MIITIACSICTIDISCIVFHIKTNNDAITKSVLIVVCMLVTVILNIIDLIVITMTTVTFVISVQILL